MIRYLLFSYKLRIIIKYVRIFFIVHLLKIQLAMCSKNIHYHITEQFST